MIPVLSFKPSPFSLQTCCSHVLNINYNCYSLHSKKLGVPTQLLISSQAQGILGSWAGGRKHAGAPLGPMVRRWHAQGAGDGGRLPCSSKLWINRLCFFHLIGVRLFPNRKCQMFSFIFIFELEKLEIWLKCTRNQHEIASSMLLISQEILLKSVCCGSIALPMVFAWISWLQLSTQGAAPLPCYILSKAEDAATHVLSSQCKV